MLNTPATRRLAAYRAKAADWQVKQPSMTHYHTWEKHVRPVTRNNGGTWQSLDNMRYGQSRAYYCDTWPAGMREIGDADKIVDLRHTGWYTDNFQDSLVKGYVLQLTGRDRKPCYIPGTYNTGCDGVTLYPLDMHDDEKDCARAADRLAEIEAESAREYDAKSQAECQTDELQSRIVEIRSELRAMIREMKAARVVAMAQFPTLCAAIRSDMAALRRESHEAWKRIQKLADNYWHAVEG